jgi:hypothetical protein
MKRPPLLLFEVMDWLVPLLRIGTPLVVLVVGFLGLRLLIRANFPKKPTGNTDNHTK